MIPKPKQNKNTVLCRYNHCRHETREVPREEALRDGALYFHADCYKDRKNIQEIAKLYKKINPQVVMQQMYNIVNNIVFEKNISSDYLLYTIRYCEAHDIPMKTPLSFHYLIGKEEIIDSYKKYHVEHPDTTVDILEDAVTYFSHKPAKQKSFTDILGGNK